MQWETIVVVDVQQGFVESARTQEVSRQIEALVLKARTARVVATVYENHPESPCARLMGWHGCAEPEQAEIPAAIASRAHILRKDTYGLTDVREVGAVGRTLVVGIDTDVCVLIIAGQLFDSGVDVYVAENLCASSGGEASHDSGVAALKRIVGEDRVVAVSGPTGPSAKR